MQRIIPICLILLLVPALAQAQEASAYATYRADLQKILGSLESKMKTIKQGSKACSDYVEASRCPKTPIQTPMTGFINPMTDDIEDVKKFLTSELAGVEAKLAERIESKDLESVTICANGPELVVKSFIEKKNSLDNGAITIQKIIDNNSEKMNEKGLRQKLSALYAGGREFDAKAAACKKEATDGNFILGALAGASPKNPNEVLIKVFERDHLHTSCSPEVLQSYKEVVDQKNGSIQQLIKKLAELSGKMKTDSTTISQVIARAEGTAKTCPDKIVSTDPQKNPKESDVSKPEEKPGNLAADEKKSAAISKAQAKPETTVADAPISGPKGKSSVNDSAEKFLADTVPEASPAPQEPTLPAEESEYSTAPLVGSNRAQESAKPEPYYGDDGARTIPADAPYSKVEMPPVNDDSAPATINNAAKTEEVSQRGPANAEQSKLSDPDLEGLTAAKETKTPAIVDDGAGTLAPKDLKARLQQDDFFKKRDLDFSSKKDTTYIQQALNKVRAQYPDEYGNSPTVSVDGVLGSRTTKTLDAVMQSPAQKAAFAKALRELMARR